MTLTAEAILNEHQLRYQTIQRSAIGFINEVYLTQKHVVKIYRSNPKGYGRELWLYSVVKPDYAPKLIAYGEGYLVLERICGSGLYRLWPNMDDAQREDTVRRIAGIVLELAGTDYKSADGLFPVHPDWEGFLTGRIGRTLEKLGARGAIPEKLAADVRRYVAENAHVLVPAVPSLVYADLHFDNLIRNDAGKLYLIDYETLCAAPKDYMLDTWKRMSVYPHLYANEEDEGTVAAKDYAHIMQWLRKYAPEFFDIEHLDKRLALYAIDYDLRILADYPNNAQVIGRISGALRS